MDLCMQIGDSLFMRYFFFGESLLQPIEFPLIINHFALLLLYLVLELCNFNIGLFFEGFHGNLETVDFVML
jgi:hypothetical protein